MGTRLNKILGYGSIVLPVGSLNLVDESVSLKDFYDWVEKNYPTEYERLWFLDDKNRQAPLSTLLVQVFTEETDEDAFSLWNGYEGVVIVPPVLNDEANEKDSIFSYAELEVFNKQSLNEMSSFGYNFNVPPFPTEYTVVNQETGETVESWDVYKYLRRLQDEDYQAAEQIKIFLNTKKLGVEVDEVATKFKLIPPMFVKLLSEYYKIFANPTAWENLKPTVLYYWT